MATTRNQPEPEVPRAERVEAIARSAIAGHEQGGIRRIILYVIVMMALALCMYFPIFAIPGLAAAGLLLATDTL